MEDGALVAMVVVEMNECIDKLKWWKLLSGGIAKEVAGVSRNNGKGWGKFSAGDPVEESEVNMKVSTRI